MSEAFIGEIRLFAGNYAPEGWLSCDGRALKIADAQNQALYSLIGITYGGDGVQTFKLPDLRGRVPLGVGPNPPPVPDHPWSARRQRNRYSDRGRDSQTQPHFQSRDHGGDLAIALAVEHPGQRRSQFSVFGPDQGRNGRSCHLNFP